MSLVQITSNQIIIMFGLIVIGFVLYKFNIISKELNKGLSNIVLVLINPIVIFLSYQRDFEIALLKGLLISFVLGVITHLISIIIAYTFLGYKRDKNLLNLERFALIYSNCSFIGIPLINGLFGSEGVFYLTSYITVFNLLVWSHGLILISGQKDKESIKKAFFSTAIISTILGLLLFLFRIRIPSIIYDTLNYIGSMNTPLAMIVAGVTISQNNIIKSFKNKRLYYISFIKLILIPLLCFLVLLPFDFPNIVLLSTILAVAAPSGATINLFALKYDNNPLYASELFAFTTIFSLVSIPLIVKIITLI